MYVIALCAVTWSGATQIFATPKDNTQPQEHNSARYVRKCQCTARVVYKPAFDIKPCTVTKLLRT